MDIFNDGVTLFGTILSALIASQSILLGLRRWYGRGWGSRHLWRKKLDRMANWVADEYIKELLGTPAFRTQGSTSGRNGTGEKPWIDRVYSTPHAWVVTRSIDERVEAWSVTITDPKFWWSIEEVTFKVIRGRLGHATFEALPTKPSGLYESRGAHTYAYAESSWLGNPGGYQNFIFMHNIAGIGTSHPSGQDDVRTGDFSEGQDLIFAPPPESEARKSIVNTLLVTSPSCEIFSLPWQLWPVANSDQARLLHLGRKESGWTWKRIIGGGRGDKSS